MSCPYGSRISGAKSAAEAAGAETKRLKDEVRALKAQQEEMAKAFTRLAAAVEGIAQDVRDMKRELYPDVETTKPALKAPAASLGGTP